MAHFRYYASPPKNVYLDWELASETAVSHSGPPGREHQGQQDVGKGPNIYYNGYVSELR